MLNLILLLSVIIGTVIAELVPKRCDECVPVLQCPAALKWVETTNKETADKLREAYCGRSNRAFMICCSDFVTMGGRSSTQEHPNSNLLPSFCGNSYYSRDLGGLGIGLYELPWMALISHETRDGLQFQCSGTVINKRYILTAASCVVGKKIAGVRIGDYNIAEEYDCVGEVCENNVQDKRLEDTIVHPEYEGAPKYTHNIALLRLQEDIDFSFKNAGPICLPRTNDSISESIENKLGTIAGWELTKPNQQSSIIRKTTIPVLPERVCHEYYRDNIESSTQFCAGNNNIESCVGDLGGPFMIETENERSPRFIQYGITASNPEECGRDSPVIYTDVRKYLTWILDNIKK